MRTLVLATLLAVSCRPAPRVTACRLPGLEEPARCGVFELPEDPEKPQGRLLPIHVAVLPARSANAQRDPIAVMLGGPGEAAIESAPDLARQLASLREDRDLLLVDQRGTGESAPLHCDLFDAEASLRHVFPPPGVEKCARELQQHADLAHYSYARFSDDLEQVRRALGYGQLNLFAASYGTRAAQDFARRHPQSVRTIFLASVVPADVAMPLPFSRASQQTLEETIAACEIDEQCRIAFPAVRSELASIAPKLQSSRVAEWFRSLLYRPRSAAMLPLLIHRASEGDWKFLEEKMLASARNYDSALAFGLFLSITCNDDVAFLPSDEEIARETQGTLLGDYRVREQQAACRLWPKAPADDRPPVRTAIPTLFVTGDADGGTPLWFTPHAAEGFSQHAILIARGQGHTEWSACVERNYARFVRDASVSDLDAECAPTPRPPFQLR